MKLLVQTSQKEHGCGSDSPMAQQQQQQQQRWSSAERRCMCEWDWSSTETPLTSKETNPQTSSGIFVSWLVARLSSTMLVHVPKSRGRDVNWLSWGRQKKDRQPQSDSGKGQKVAAVWASKQTCWPQRKLSIYTLHWQLTVELRVCGLKLGSLKLSLTSLKLQQKRPASMECIWPSRTLLPLLLLLLTLSHNSCSAKTWKVFKNLFFFFTYGSFHFSFVQCILRRWSKRVVAELRTWMLTLTWRVERWIDILNVALRCLCLQKHCCDFSQRSRS